MASSKRSNSVAHAPLLDDLVRQSSESDNFSCSPVSTNINLFCPGIARFRMSHIEGTGIDSQSATPRSDSRTLRHARKAPHHHVSSITPPKGQEPSQEISSNPPGLELRENGIIITNLINFYFVSFHQHGSADGWETSMSSLRVSLVSALQCIKDSTMRSLELVTDLPN